MTIQIVVLKLLYAHTTFSWSSYVCDRRTLDEQSSSYKRRFTRRSATH